MDSKKYIDLAKSYVALSNKHDLKQIMLMFEVDATYRSTYFGTFAGIEAINKMMVNFFSRFPDVYWEVVEYKQVKDATVAFAFVMTGTDAATGELVKRHGLEQISFASDGLVSHIDVRKSHEEQFS